MTKEILILPFILYNLSLFAQNFSKSSAEYYYDKIIVNDSKFDFKTDAKYDENQNFNSWDNFPTNEKDFELVSSEDAQGNWTKYCSKIIELCSAKNLDFSSLTKCFDIIKSHEERVALLPIAAYECKNGKHKVWVIRCKWENKYTSNSKVDKDAYIPYMHVREFAIDTSNYKIIAFRTCA